MLNPKKWPKKYQYLALIVIVIFIIILSPSKVHAIDPPQYTENYGTEAVKGAAIDGLAAIISFIGAAESVATGNLYTGFALATFTGLQADKAINQALQAWHYYFDEPETSQNFEPDTFSFQRD